MRKFHITLCVLFAFLLLPTFFVGCVAGSDHLNIVELGTPLSAKLKQCNARDTMGVYPLETSPTLYVSKTPTSLWNLGNSLQHQYSIRVVHNCDVCQPLNPHLVSFTLLRDGISQESLDIQEPAESCQWNQLNRINLTTIPYTIHNDEWARTWISSTDLDSSGIVGQYQSLLAITKTIQITVVLPNGRYPMVLKELP